MGDIVGGTVSSPSLVGAIGPKRFMGFFMFPRVLLKQHPPRPADKGDIEQPLANVAMFASHPGWDFQVRVRRVRPGILPTSRAFLVV